MAGLIRRAPLAFFSFLEDLLQGPADETHHKKDDILMFMMLEDILMFMMLEEFMKNCRNAEVRTESYAERIVPAMSDSVKWNKNLKPVSVTNPNDPRSEVDCLDCNLRLVSP